MVCVANLRLLYGDVVERASLSRDLLVPVSGRLSGDPSGLHRRCVLGQYLGLWRRADDVRAYLAPFGDIEAVAHCDRLCNAVIVFRTAESAAAAIRRQAETHIGVYSAVPPLDWALPLRFVRTKLIEVAFYPPPALSSPDGVVTTSESEAASTQATRTGSSTEAMGNATQWTPQPVESRPVIVFLDSPSEQGTRGPHGTTRFVPSPRSKIFSPVLGEDGRLWIDGVNLTYHDKGMGINSARIRVVQVAPPPANYYFH